MKNRRKVIVLILAGACFFAFFMRQIRLVFLPSDAFISGTVVNEKGEAIKGVEIGFTDYQGGAANLGKPVTGDADVTDANGRFSLLKKDTSPFTEYTFAKDPYEDVVLRKQDVSDNPVTVTMTVYHGPLRELPEIRGEPENGD